MIIDEELQTLLDLSPQLDAIVTKFSLEDLR